MWDSVQPTQTWINSNIPEVKENTKYIYTFHEKHLVYSTLCMCVYDNIVHVHMYTHVRITFADCSE